MISKQAFTLTDLPGELGKKIIGQINNAKRPSHDEINVQARALELEIMKAEKEDAKNNYSGK